MQNNTIQQQNLFDSIPDAIPTDESVHQQAGQSYPSIIWMGRFNENKNGDTGGEWVIRAEDLPSGQVPGPQGWWQLRDVRFGTDPNAAPVPCYTSQRLRCTPIGIRKRMIVTDDQKREHYYPQMTKASRRVAGKLSFHYQVMVMMDGVDEPLVLALRGFAKTASWSNNPGAKFGRSEFPKGVEDTLADLSKKASQAKSIKIPMLCFWLIDLTPVFYQGKPLWVDVGHSVYMNPFGLDMTVKTPGQPGQDGYPNGRFVGTELLQAYEGMRRDFVMEWEAKWADAAAMQGESRDDGNGFDDEGAASQMPIEDDEIPF